jgi:hypothetical protein
MYHFLRTPGSNRTRLLRGPGELRSYLFPKTVRPVKFVIHTTHIAIFIDFQYIPENIQFNLFCRAA